MTESIEKSGLICAYQFDGSGSYTELAEEAFETPSPSHGFLWLHLSREAQGVGTWLNERSGIESRFVATLLAEDTRPRCTVCDEGILLNLRGVNLNPGAAPEDMVSVRLWVEKHRVISDRRLRLMAIQDIRDAMSTGERIESPGDLIAHLCRNLLDRMEAVVIDLADRVDELEESVLTTQSDKVRVELGSIRHRAVLLRRYVAPQRDAIEQLANLQIEYLGPGSRNLLMEAANRVTRYAEELDSIRDRCGLVQDDLETRLNFQINRTIYHLSVVAGIFLPLALLRVFSVSMSAEFLAKKKWRFWLVCGALALVAVFEIWFFPSPQMVVGQ